MAARKTLRRENEPEPSSFLLINLSMAWSLWVTAPVGHKHNHRDSLYSSSVLYDNSFHKSWTWNMRPWLETVVSELGLFPGFRGCSRFCRRFSSTTSSAVCLWSSVNALLPTSPAISSTASSVCPRGTRTCSRYSSATVPNPVALLLAGQCNQTLAASCITAGSSTLE